MGIEFIVGHPISVFPGEFGNEVLRLLAEKFGLLDLKTRPLKPYISEEIAWVGWAELQEAAVSKMGAERVPHLLSVSAWRGAYLPASITPSIVVLPNHQPLECASLPRLVEELRSFGQQRGLPIDVEPLRELFDDGIDDSLTETYVQAMLAAHVATDCHQILWLIK